MSEISIYIRRAPIIMENLNTFDPDLVKQSNFYA